MFYKISLPKTEITLNIISGKVDIKSAWNPWSYLAERDQAKSFLQPSMD